MPYGSPVLPLERMIASCASLLSCSISARVFQTVCLKWEPVTWTRRQTISLRSLVIESL